MESVPAAEETEKGFMVQRDSRFSTTKKGFTVQHGPTRESQSSKLQHTRLTAFDVFGKDTAHQKQVSMDTNAERALRIDEDGAYEPID